MTSELEFGGCLGTGPLDIGACVLGEGRKGWGWDAFLILCMVLEHKGGYVKSPAIGRCILIR